MNNSFRLTVTASLWSRSFLGSETKTAIFLVLLIWFNFSEVTRFEEDTPVKGVCGKMAYVPFSDAANAEIDIV